MVDMPPQQEVVSPVPEETKEDTGLNYFDYVKSDAQQQENIVISETNEKERIEITLGSSRTSRSPLQFEHIQVEHSSSRTGPIATPKRPFSSKRGSISSKQLTAQETIDEYTAQMERLAARNQNELGIDKIVELHNYYTKGVVARNSDGTEAISPLGTQEQLNDVLEKATDKALNLLSGKHRLGWMENSPQNIDAFLRILPEKERNDFITNRDAIVKNAQTYEEYRNGVTLDKKEKKPSKLKTWFKNLFRKKASQPVTITEKPWYETFSFDTSKPMESIQTWCEKTGEGKLSHEQYQMAKSRIPEEYLKVATHMGTWYRQTKDRKDFSWDKLPETRRKEFVEANEAYKQNKATKTANKRSTKSIGAAYDGFRDKREHRMDLRRRGLGNSGIGKF